MAKSGSSGKKLSVLGYEEVEERGLLDRQVVRDFVDAEKLGDEVKEFINAMGTVISKVSEHIANYDLDTVSVTAEVSAKGKLSLLGTGGEMGGKGGMTFTFKRSAPKKTA